MILVLYGNEYLRLVRLGVRSNCLYSVGVSLHSRRGHFRRYYTSMFTSIDLRDYSAALL